MSNQHPSEHLLITIRLAHIHGRLAWIADREAKAAWVNGYGCHGEFGPERDRLTAESDLLLLQLQASGGTLPFTYQ